MAVLTSLKALAVGTAITALALAGCASVSKTYDAQGREVYALDCTGWGRSWVTCQDKAAELCGPRGYTVTAHASGPIFMLGTLTSNRTMTIMCGPETGPAGGVKS